MIQKITLLELNKSIQETIKQKFSESVWVVAEISEIKINRNGHCYLELIEKDLVSDNIIAKSRATIWSFTFRMLKPYFENMTGYELSPGIKILVQANVEFHELYGFSLNITDIDPNYTIGDLAAKRAEILNQLEQDGVINMNKEVKFPLVPQKIAVISSETAAGYQDFINQLNNNPSNYKFYTKLFPTIMQGLNAEDSIIKSLDYIYKHEDFFDIVVIIRGGGSQSDLSCFDNYNVATNIAQFPIPILTGIGHDKDESIADIVAFQKLKTPTAVADYIIDRTHDFEISINDYLILSTDILNEYIENQKTLLNHYGSLSIPFIKSKIEKRKSQLDLYIEKLRNNSVKNITRKKTTLKTQQESLKYLVKKHFIEKHSLCLKHIELLAKQINYELKNEFIKLKNLKNKIELLNPDMILKRGYSITYFKNKKLTSSDQIKENDEIITKLFKGVIRSKVQNSSS